jgi:hypothetical protein
MNQKATSRECEEIPLQEVRNTLIVSFIGAPVRDLITRRMDRFVERKSANLLKSSVRRKSISVKKTF